MQVVSTDFIYPVSSGLMYVNTCTRDMASMSEFTKTDVVSVGTWYFTIFLRFMTMFYEKIT